MSNMHGYHEHLMGGYSMRRRFEATDWALWVNGAVNFRNNNWFGSCPQLKTDTAKANAVARGELKYVQITVDDGVVESAEEAVPNDRVSQSDAAGPNTAAEYVFGNQHEVFEMWFQTVGGAADFEIYFAFDVPEVKDTKTPAP